ncbi:9226_t:CDS:2 [Paraglomus brasilianum]|uniref:9226_t:CDS:1 n=1 Tax=Paraglomus brasilianum TaxID=144538 RepID=A0A9N8VRH6_9GLOM|nr:9226_t:CDS:2 [Paraglomus brasilianum]
MTHMDMLEFALQYGREHPEATKEEVYDAYKTSKQEKSSTATLSHKEKSDVGWVKVHMKSTEDGNDDSDVDIISQSSISTLPTWAEDENDDSDVDIISQSSISTLPTSTKQSRSISLDTASSKLPVEPSDLIRQNWRDGRYKHISFPGHGSNVVTCLQFDSEKIVSGSDDQCINVYETATGKLINRLEGHGGGVWALQYVGNTLVSGSTDRTVRVWDIKRGVCTHAFSGHTGTVRCLQIIMPQATSDSSIVEPPIPLIVTGSRDSTLRVWRLPDTTNDTPFAPSNPSSPSDSVSLQDSPYFIRTIQGHTHSVRTLAGVGNTLVSGSYDCSVRVWNIMTGECLWKLTGHTQKVYSVVLDAKRNRCMSGSMDGIVKVWSLEDGTCVWSLEGHSSLVGLLDFSHDYLVSAAADSSLRIWNPNDGTCKHVLTTHTGAITCFQHDEHKVISGSDGTLKMWDMKTGKFVRDLLTGLSGTWQVRFDERRCVAAVQRNKVTFFEVLDFGVHNVEEDNNNITEENGEWIPIRWRC